MSMSNVLSNDNVCLVRLSFGSTIVTGVDFSRKCLAINAYTHVLPDPVGISMSLKDPGDDRIIDATAH